MKTLIALSILAIGAITFNSCRNKPKVEVPTNAVNDFHAYENADSIAKYAVGSANNPIIKH